jgi:hypothetical protein
VTHVDIATAETDVLINEFSRIFMVTAELLAYAAAIWRELENRGVDLDVLRKKIRASRYLIMIANGTLDPRVVANHMGQTLLINAMSNISLYNQRQLLDAGSITLVKVNDDGFEEVQKPLHELNSQEILLAFEQGHVRSAAEQMVTLGKQSVRHKRQLRATRANVTFEGDYVKVGRTVVLQRKMFDALSDHFGIDAEKVLTDAARKAQEK